MAAASRASVADEREKRPEAVLAELQPVRVELAGHLQVRPIIAAIVRLPRRDVHHDDQSFGSDAVEKLAREVEERRLGNGVELAETLRRDEHVVVVAQLHVRRRKSRLLGLVRDSPHPEVKVPLVAAQVHDVLHHAEGVLVAVDGVDFHRGQLPVELPAERDEESQKLAARAAAEVEDPDHVPLRKHLLHGRHGPHQMFEDDGALKDGSRKVRSKIIQILIVRVFQILARLFPVRIVTGSRRLQNHALQKVIRPGQSDQLGHACAPFFLDDGFILIPGAFTPRNRKFAVCYSCMHQIAFSTRLRDASPWPTAKDAFSSSLLEPHLTF